MFKVKNSLMLKPGNVINFKVVVVRFTPKIDIESIIESVTHPIIDFQIFYRFPTLLQSTVE